MWAAVIETEVIWSPKGGSVIDPDFSVFFKILSRILHPSSTSIDERQIGGFDVGYAAAGEFAADKLSDCVAILAEVA